MKEKERKAEKSSMTALYSAVFCPKLSVFLFFENFPKMTTIEVKIR